MWLKPVWLDKRTQFIATLRDPAHASAIFCAGLRSSGHGALDEDRLDDMASLQSKVELCLAPDGDCACAKKVKDGPLADEATGSSSVRATGLSPPVNEECGWRVALPLEYLPRREVHGDCNSSGLLGDETPPDCGDYACTTGRTVPPPNLLFAPRLASLLAQTDNVNSSHGDMGRQQPVESRPDGQGADSDEDNQNQASGSGIGVVERLCWPWPNPGSVNHPELCSPPCKYFRKTRGCKDGAFCTRCHICKFTGTGRKKRGSTGSVPSTSEATVHDQFCSDNDGVAVEHTS